MLFNSCVQGATGITVGAVVGSIAALAVAAGIFVFFVWKWRKNSNGKSGINANSSSQERSRSIKQLKTVYVFYSLF